MTPTTLVIPTMGRPSLEDLLRALAHGTRAVTAPVVLVDDRPGGDVLVLPDDVVAGLPDLRILRTGGGGPARARNLGWRHSRTRWVSFLDDDVLTSPEWYADLLDDLAAADTSVVGIQGVVRVPLPTGRRPTDWERGTAGLEDAQWITADLSYRREALAAVGGFDERFPRAYREDADLGLRITQERGRIVRGRRRVTHPVRPVDDWISLRQQAGNADDALMDAVHADGWRERAGAPLGRRNRHLAVTVSGLVAVLAGARGNRRAAVGATAAWAVGTLELWWARTAPGPRTPAEVRRMALTSAVIPPVASWHLVRGVARHRGAPPWRGLPDLVLFDRDDTLVRDVPYNGDPDLVEPVPSAQDALARLRREGIRVGVVSNQSGVGLGLLTTEQVEAVNARVEQLLGPFDAWRWCPHHPDDGCGCRKPAAGMVKEICAELGVDPSRTVVIGDTGGDVLAARHAGATGILVPTAATRGTEIGEARHVATDLDAAIDLVLGGQW